MKHHRIGGSTLSRIFQCAYSVPATESAREEDIIPADSLSTLAADEGTMVHQIGEECIEKDLDPTDFLGSKIKVGSRTFVVQDHHVDNASIYVNYCNKLKTHPDCALWGVELNSNLGHLYSGESIGGPCDFMALIDDVLYIVDYKNGKYLVEATAKQFLLYALGVYEAEKEKFPDIKTICTTVVQPNAPHVDGPIRSRYISVRRLLRWKKKKLTPVVARVQKVTKLINEGVPHDQLPTELKPTPSSDACFFCPVNGICPESIKEVKRLTKNNLQGDRPEVTRFKIEELEALVKEKAFINKIIVSATEAVKLSIENGRTSENFKTVDSFGNREHLSERKTKRHLKGLLDRREMYCKTIKSPAQLEAAIYVKHKGQLTRADAKKIISGVTHQERRGVALVPHTDKRNARSTDPRDDFKDEM